MVFEISGKMNLESQIPFKSIIESNGLTDTNNFRLKLLRIMIPYFKENFSNPRFQDFWTKVQVHLTTVKELN